MVRTSCARLCPPRIGDAVYSMGMSRCEGKSKRLRARANVLNGKRRGWHVARPCRSTGRQYVPELGFAACLRPEKRYPAVDLARPVAWSRPQTPAVREVKAGDGAAIGSALFSGANKAQTNPMRQVTLLLLLLLPLAGCAGGPQALGITGPRGSSLGTTAPPPAGQDPLDSPNSFQSGTRYSPSSGPTTGSGRFWGYN